VDVPRVPLARRRRRSAKHLQLDARLLKRCIDCVGRHAARLYEGCIIRTVDAQTLVAFPVDAVDDEDLDKAA